MPGLMDPLELKDVRLRNRVVLPPMETKLATAEGEVTEEMLAHYRQFAPHLGMVIVEHSYVDPEGALHNKQLGSHADALIPGLENLASEIKDCGAVAVLQLNHAGLKVEDNKIDSQPLGPSPSDPNEGRKLTVDEIEEIAHKFGRAAIRAEKAGFDGVEVHGAHGFLLNQFLSPLTNKRSDRFGGSFSSRASFPLRVVEKIKGTIGDMVLLYRLGSVDLDPNGMDVEDGQRFASALEDYGVEVIDVSGGHCGSRPDQLDGSQGYFVPQAKEIKDAVGVPVIGVGGITKPEYADRIVREEQVDLVAVGRAQWSNPDWAERAKVQLKKS
ncbi:MAG: NADH:flavin oxidoreductase [Candidatus Bipolaricaulota bacterium]